MVLNCYKFGYQVQVKVPNRITQIKNDKSAMICKKLEISLPLKLLYLQAHDIDRLLALKYGGSLHYQERHEVQ